MPERARDPTEAPHSVADVVQPRTPDGRFAKGFQRGPDRGPRKSFLRAVVLQALAGAQYRKVEGKKKPQLVRAAALNDMVVNLQKILAGKKVENAKHFLGALELIHDVVDEDTPGANAMRTTLAGDYRAIPGRRRDLSPVVGAANWNDHRARVQPEHD